jgi:hypothetical protein
MLCPSCQKDCPKEDFYINQSDCYKCVYKKKTEKEKKVKKRCAICDSAIRMKFKLVYCSDECAAIGYGKKRHDKWGSNYTCPVNKSLY